MLLLAFLVACSSPEPETTPFEGPGYDPEAGLLVDQDTFLLAVTELHVKNLPDPGARFGDHASAIGSALYDPTQPIVPGFVGGSFRNVGQLEWWTLTVWTDEASMMDFVLSEPHVNAMADLSFVSSAARSTHLEISRQDVPVDWDTALGALDSVDWLVGDGS